MLQLSDTTYNSGIMQMIEQTTTLGLGTITSDSDSLYYFINLVNFWYLIACLYAWKVDGNWHFDDSNHTTRPLPTTTLAAQLDYTLPSTAFRIRIVEVMDANGNYYPLTLMTDEDERYMREREQLEAGMPRKYKLEGNLIILDRIPDLNLVTPADGLRLTIDREPDKFTVSDTTQQPGIISAFQPILYYGPSFEYGTIHNLPGVVTLCERMLGQFPGLLEMIKEFYSKRNKDDVPRIGNALIYNNIGE